MPQTPLELLASSLDDDPDLVPAVTEQVRRRVPALAELPEAEVRAHVAALLHAGLRAAGSGAPAAAHELELAAALAVTRAEQGVPVVALLAGLHVGHAEVWRRARERAQALGLSPDVVLDAVHLHGEWSESVRAATIEAHARTEVSQARSRADEQTALVNALVVHGPGPAELQALEALGLDPDRLWLRRTRSWTAPDAPAQHHRLSARVGPDVVELLPRRPDAPPDLGPTALVGPFAAARAPEQHALAGLLLSAAEARGRRGTTTVADVALDLAVASLPEAGPALAAALLPGLDPARPGDRSLVTTLATWLEQGQRLAETGAALYVHPNTVRHRLGRLRRAGVPVDAADLRPAVSLWWACRSWLSTG